jgi:hypothetical protein
METTMLYKTIVLELLQNRPQIHEKLRRQRMVLTTMEYYAHELKALHEAWKQRLSQTRPQRDASRIASEAMELALYELEALLPSDSSSADEDQPSLDDFLTWLKEQRIPPA